jgi:hypothetical protein
MGRGKITYKNAWVTDKRIREGKVRLVTDCGRARWKIENEHNNELKNHGYNLEHNFGHRKNHACEITGRVNVKLLHGIRFLWKKVHIRAPVCQLLLPA